MENLLKEYQIAHVGYITEDLDKVVARVTELYEIDDWYVFEWTPSRVWYKGENRDDYRLKIALSLPATGEGTRFEIIQPLTEGLHMDFLKAGTQTISHICHVVKDFDAALKQFLDNGCELVFESEYTDDIRGYRRCHYVFDPIMNNMVEIAEIPYFRNEKGERI